MSVLLETIWNLLSKNRRRGSSEIKYWREGDKRNHPAPLSYPYAFLNGLELMSCIFYHDVNVHNMYIHMFQPETTSNTLIKVKWSRSGAYFNCYWYIPAFTFLNSNVYLILSSLWTLTADITWHNTFYVVENVINVLWAATPSNNEHDENYWNL